MNAALWITLIAVGLFFSTETVLPMLDDYFYRYDPLFKKYGTQFGISWEWLKAIAMNESSLGSNPLVMAGLASTDGLSYGLMQVTITTAGDIDPLVTPQKLNDPEYSIKIAAQFLKQLALRFQSDQRKVIMSYNQGAGNTLKGKEYAAEYYERFLRNLLKVKEGEYE